VRVYWRFLRTNPVFATLWAGEAVSMLGSGLLITSWGFWFYGLTGSPLLLSLYAVAMMVVRTVVSPWAGVWIDRLDRRQVLLWANLVRAVTTLAPLVVLTRERVWLAVVAAGIGTAAQTFFRPAWGALLPNLVPEGHVLRANALQSMAMQMAYIAGPAAGGLVFNLWGPAPTFVLDCLSYLFGAVTIVLTFRRMPPTAPTEAAPDRSTMREAREAFAFCRGRRDLWGLLVVVAVSSLGFGIMNGLWTPFMVDVVHAGAATFGAILTAQGLGALGVAYLMGRTARLPESRQITAIWGSLLFLAGSCFLYTTFPRFWVIAPLTFLEGLVLEVMGLAQTTWWQERVPDAVRGRVLSLRELVDNGAAAIAVVAGGAVAQVAGVRASFYLYVVMVLAGGLVARAVLVPAGQAAANRPVAR
jgi:MFS transporter, DHA3 family, macrolide efflux protein